MQGLEPFGLGTVYLAIDVQAVSGITKGFVYLPYRFHCGFDTFFLHHTGEGAKPVGQAGGIDQVSRGKNGKIFAVGHNQHIGKTLGFQCVFHGVGFYIDPVEGPEDPCKSPALLQKLGEPAADHHIVQPAVLEKAPQEAKQRSIDPQTVVGGEYQYIGAAPEGAERLKRRLQKGPPAAVGVDGKDLVRAKLPLQLPGDDLGLDGLAVQKILPASKVTKYTYFVHSIPHIKYFLNALKPKHIKWYAARSLLIFSSCV